jgi:uncharacterized protein
MMAYLEGEPAAQEVRLILRRARKQEVSVLFSLINYGECLYIIEREQGLQQAQRAVGIVDQLPLHVVPVDRGLVFEAARLKARYPISFADAFCASVAKRNKARVVTGDPEFKSLEPQIQIHWLPDRLKRR